ncbi:ABC transporter substrate-binding protein [Lichenifustis flavocetrariae]|uniref:Extracellular solute-binding protein n=1 Tax=Lichenifustis flavocetrariae TaxID=2949735 RepID=A0AA42CJ09_9HYPH|nr:extracellular solute-binding protein [Lichenifustis flavocetrariae]MCW6507471.1 extracellular solute-binding protein [Lichenifustis flavocetrariae]
MLKPLLLGVSLCLALTGSGFATTLTAVHVETDPGERALWDRIGKDYTAQHPDITVQFQYIENEAFKAKLPTMLQSKDPPSLIFSWGGGVMLAQQQADFIRPITAAVQPFAASLVPTAAKAFQSGGDTLGVPVLMSKVAFFYNKALFAKAGVKAADIKSWDDFLAAVKTIKAAGITPIVVGAGEKWPMHFYWSYLVLREGGADILKRAKAGEDGGFTGPVFVDAGKKLQELAKLDPFQPGYQGTLHLQAAGLFGDGKGAMQLMGNWLVNTQKNNAADSKGLSDDNIGTFSFPTVAGGKGLATDALGGVNGFLVSKNAPKEAEDFLRFFSQEKYQKEAAAKGYYIPAIVGTGADVSNPVTKSVAEDLAHATALQIFFDQDLGPSVGRVVNDISVAIPAGQMTPEDGAKALQQAFDEQ